MTDLPLEAATKDVIARYNKGNDMLVSAAVALRRLKERVEAGEAGEDVGWDEYRHTHLEQHISRNWINKQLKLAPPGATEIEVETNVAERRKAMADGAKKRRAAQQNGGDYVVPAPAEADMGKPAHGAFIETQRPPAESAPLRVEPKPPDSKIATDPLTSLKAAFLTLDGRARYAFREWVNGQLSPAPTSSQPPTQPKPPTDKMPKILAALDAAGTVGLTVGELYNKAGAYLTDLDLAVKQGLIHEAGEKYFNRSS